MVKQELSMDMGEVLDLFRDRLSNMSKDDITFIFNRDFAERGEKLYFKQDSEFMFEAPKTNDLSEIAEVETKTITCDECDLENPACNQCGGTREVPCT